MDEEFELFRTDVLDDIGKVGYTASIKDFLPGSAVLPEKVFIPQPGDSNPKEFAWEED